VQTSNSPPKLLLDAREAAAALTVSERFLWGITAPRGDLPCVRLGRSVRYHVSDLEAWINANKTRQETEPSENA
jgi:predicted DNA-binding transcriptional regulator AlpA